MAEGNQGEGEQEAAESKSKGDPCKDTFSQIKEAFLPTVGLAATIGSAVLIAQSFMLGYLPNFDIQKTASFLVALFILSVGAYAIILGAILIPGIFLKEAFRLQGEGNISGRVVAVAAFSAAFGLGVFVASRNGIQTSSVFGHNTPPHPYESLIPFVPLLIPILFGKGFSGRVIATLWILLAALFAGVATFMSMIVFPEIGDDDIFVGITVLVVILCAFSWAAKQIPLAMKLALPLSILFIGMKPISITCVEHLGLGHREVASLRIKRKFAEPLAKAQNRTLDKRESEVIFENVVLKLNVGNEVALGLDPKNVYTTPTYIIPRSAISGMVLRPLYPTPSPSPTPNPSASKSPVAPAPVTTSSPAPASKGP